MVRNMLIFVAVIIIVGLIATYLALRLPRLDVPETASIDEKLKVLDEWFTRVHAKGKFNGTVLLSHKGKVIFSRSYGADRASNPGQLSEHSSFNLASVSKQFTAMGIVILKQQSKLDYQDKASKYIPELSHYRDITIQHLLHHTSGLPDYMALASKNKNGSDVFTTPDMLALYEKHQPKLKFEPGSKFKYSNTGYVLLAEIIERVSGKTFQDFMAAQVFNPLGMNDTQVHNLLSEGTPRNRVYGFKYKYWLFGGEKIPSDLGYFDGVAGDGGVYSSAHDLNIWHNALNDGTLVPDKAYKIAYAPAVLEDGSESNYGYGWVINEDNSVEHTGGWQGFASYIYRNLENGNLVVILDNSSNSLRVGSVGFRFNSIGINLKHFLKTL